LRHQIDLIHVVLFTTRPRSKLAKPIKCLLQSESKSFTYSMRYS